MSHCPFCRSPYVVAKPDDEPHSVCRTCGARWSPPDQRWTSWERSDLSPRQYLDYSRSKADHPSARAAPARS
jgi:hypothetical protein